ncbi:MAG TPA: hypothetical protein VGR28_02285, partial [Candidatus Thermoplasmatota archaeon]|nr:hypothetical protein [Candidatus Thermoplasmatota archaeon]
MAVVLLSALAAAGASAAAPWTPDGKAAAAVGTLTDRLAKLFDGGPPGMPSPLPEPPHDGLVDADDPPWCVLEGAPCPISWDPGDASDMGDDAVFITYWTGAQGAPPALPFAPLEPPRLEPPPSTSTPPGLGLDACAWASCAAPAALRADADGDAALAEAARQLAGAVRPGALGPWRGERSLAVPPWQELLPALHLQAGLGSPATPASVVPPAPRPSLAAPGSAPALGDTRALADVPRPLAEIAQPGVLAIAEGVPTESVAAVAPTAALRSILASAAAPQGLLAAVAIGASLALAWGLYTRVTAHRALEQRTRRRIFDAVQANPGLRVGTLRSMLGLSYPVLERHVRLLLHFGILEAHGPGQRRLFVAGALPPKARAASIAASAPRARLVLGHLRAHGGCTLA